MTLALSAIKEKIENYGEVCIYQEIESFKGVEFDAIVEKFKFLYDVGLSNISRIAVVTNKKWLHKIVDHEDKLFKKIDMKNFSIENKNEAIEFLKSA